uniref:Uncharacterized protein n=1 Tax=Arion vulgaris TaxID=1028688 RepID=A0A0B7ALM3_9EUPU
MSVSQFDDLLEEFAPSTTTVTKTGSIGALNDDFDPFGPPAGATDTTDLLNISPDVPIRNGDTSNGLDLDFGTSTSPEFAEQHNDMSIAITPTEPLFELDSEPANPPYHLPEEADTIQSTDPLYEFNEETATSPKANNALYDFDNDEPAEEPTEEPREEGDLIHEFSKQQNDDTDFVQNSHPQYDDTNLLDDFEVVQREEAVNHKYDPVTLNDEPEEIDTEIVEDYTAQDDVEEGNVGDEPAPQEEIPFYPSIPDVEITESPAQNFDEEDDIVVGEIEQEPPTDVEVRDEVEEDEVAAAVGGDVAEEVESENIPSTYSEQDSLISDTFSHERREKDLEHYCMDREESDLMEEHESVHEPPMDSLKLREERSRSPSRSIGPETPEDRERREPSETPETDTTEEVDSLRTRDDRSHAPSRSLEPEEAPKGDNVVDDVQALSRSAHAEHRYSDSERAQAHEEQVSDQWARDGNLRSPDSDRHTGKQETTHHSEPTQAVQSHTDTQQDEEDEEEGVYENQPTKRGDVVREADTDRTADLPTTGTAHNLREKFLLAQQEAAAPTRSKREITPPVHGTGGEYVSEPRGYVERYEGKAESGVFESQPVVKSDVITSSSQVEEAKVESGFTKSTAAKFKELQNKSSSPSGKRELSPDRSGRVEFVSEPRGHVEQYEGKSESGVFESEPVVNPDVVRSGEEVKEKLPERGTARSMADKFRQISSDTSTPTGARGKREITPDNTGRVEYVSEPRGHHTEDYDVRVDAGVFENQPQRNADVITSDSVADEVVPERGYARNVAAKFKELETNVKSPPLSPGRRKEFTPPREDERFHQAGVLESTPDFKSDVIHSGDLLEEALPERGTAKNIAQRFRQLETDSKTPGSFKGKKEFTPPPGDSGVYENQPKQFHADYNKPAESGIIENQPLKRDDVVRGDEPPKYEVELPERGAAKNLVSKWKQLESEGSKVKSPGSAGRPKEFTPPRDEPRIAEQRKSPRTPLSPSGNDQLDNGSVHPSDLPGQYQPQNEPAVFESNPQQRTDVLKEGDTDWTEGMPKKDTAKKMLAKFQNIQAEANKQSPGPVSRKTKDVCNK